MSDTNPISPPVGSAPAPAAPSDPVGAAAPAPSVTPSVPQPAISGEAPATGTTAPPTPAPSSSAADAALNALLAEGAAAHNQNPATPPATAPASTPPASSEQPPTAQPNASEPQAPEPETEEPNQAEIASKNVPLKKLTRALESRRQVKQENEKLTTELTKERQITDKVLQTFSAAGVAPENLTPFLTNLARAKSDAQAQANVLRFLGIQAPAPTQATPQVDGARLVAALEAYDVDTAKSLLSAAGILPSATQPPAAPPQVQPPQATQQQQPVSQPPPRQAEPAAPNALIQTVAAMGEVMRNTFGEPEAKRLSGLIDAEAKANIEYLESMRAIITVESAAEVWKAAQRKVLQAEQSRKAAPPTQTPNSPPPSSTHMRPGQPVPPQPKTADELFADFQAGRA